MTKCRSKREAMQWYAGSVDQDPDIEPPPGPEDIVAWVNTNGGEASYIPVGPLALATNQKPLIAVRRADGWAYVLPGQYVVTGSEWFNANENCPPPAGRRLRDFYPCDPDTFEQS